MSKIILLNGASSSGKTSLARAIQHKSAEPWLRLGIDTVIDMMPDQYLPSGSKAEEGLTFLPGSNKRGATMKVQAGPWGKQVFSCLPLIANVFAEHKNNLIIDEVILDKKNLDQYVTALQGHIVYFVGVFCDFNVMQEREILRRDRSLGLSNDQEGRVHPPSHTYDLTLDTTSDSPFALADKVLEFMRTHPSPQGFSYV